MILNVFIIAIFLVFTAKLMSLKNETSAIQPNYLRNRPTAYKPQGKLTMSFFEGSENYLSIDLSYTGFLGKINQDDWDFDTNDDNGYATLTWSAS